MTEAHPRPGWRDPHSALRAFLLRWLPVASGDQRSSDYGDPASPGWRAIPAVVIFVAVIAWLFWSALA